MKEVKDSELLEAISELDAKYHQFMDGAISFAVHVDNAAGLSMNVKVCGIGVSSPEQTAMFAAMLQSAATDARLFKYNGYAVDFSE